MRNLNIGDKVYLPQTTAKETMATEAIIIGISGGTQEPIVYDCGWFGFDLSAIEANCVFLSKAECEEYIKNNF